MPDYRTPVTPAEVCKRLEEALQHKAEKLRRDADILLHEADAVAEAERLVFAERMRYEQHQPKETEGAQP